MNWYFLVPGRKNFSEDWINSLVKICFFCIYCYWSYNKPSSLCISLALPMHAYIKSVAMPIEQTVSQCSIVFAHACIRMLLFNIERLLLYGLWWCLCEQARSPGSSCLLLPAALFVCIGQRGLASQIQNSHEFLPWDFYPKNYLSRLFKNKYFFTLVMCVMVQSFSLGPIILIL